MDNVKINSMKSKKHLQCIQLMNCIHQMKVDLPLYILNQDRAIRFDFADVEYEIACNVIHRVLHMVFSGRNFWICEYGDNCAADLIKKRFFDKRNVEIEIIPYRSNFIDKDAFQYLHNSIACTKISAEDFYAHAYIKYVLRDRFLSNTIFLIDDERKIALQIYDRRGMDVAAMDINVIIQLFNTFRQYVHKAYFAKIASIAEHKPMT